MAAIAGALTSGLASKNPNGKIGLGSVVKGASSLSRSSAPTGPSAASAASAATAPSALGSLLGGVLTQKDVIKTVDDMKRAENMEILEQRKTKAMERMAKSNFRLFMLSFLKDLSPYIVLALIIIVIVVLIKGGGRLLTPLYMLDSKRRSAFSSVKGIRQRTVDYFKVKFGGLFEMLSPGYKVRLFFGMFSPFGGVKYNAIPRPRLYSGRCDNLRWIQQDNNGRVDLSQDGAAGKCFSAVRPKDIVWNLDISKMPDFYDLPQIRQDALKDKMRITIPYDSEDSIRDGNTFFVPRCDKAYYGSDRKNLVNQGKGKMALEDTGTTCRLVAHPLSKAKYSVSNATQSKLAKLLERIKTSG